MSRAARAAYFTAAPALSLILFWRILITWFLNDDFAWLAKPLDVQTWRDLPAALFASQAQGTVRVLSERVFFLIFGSLFGLHALPYRLWVLATWFADLTLANLIGARLTGSRAAGLFAAILWAASANVTYALDRVAAYNETLCSLCILAAFYSRLRSIESGKRGWALAEWIAYLAGFGALEIIVMYPAIVLLHCWLFAKKRLRAALPLLIPALIFGAAHLFLIPKARADYYAVIVDRRLPGTLLHYLASSLGSIDLGRWIPHTRGIALTATALISFGLLLFGIARLRRGEYLAVFFLGWFLLLIAPVLPLPNHVFEYYATLPELGLAWLGGWAIARGWRAGTALRVATLLLAAMYVAGSALQIDAYTRWFYERSLRMRTVVEGLRDAARAHPGSTFLLDGVDNDLFACGFEDKPFRLVGAQRVYLVPDGEQGIEARADLGGLKPWISTPQGARRLLDRGQARVYRVSPDSLPNSLIDETQKYAEILRADPRSSRIDFVDAGDPRDAAQLGTSWYAAETGLRWMPKSATVRMSGPANASERLYVTGYVPPTIIAAGPVTLRFRVAEVEIGDGKIEKDGPFAFDFALPGSLIGKGEIEITIEASRVLRPATDPRDFGAVFGTFAIR